MTGKIKLTPPSIGIEFVVGDDFSIVATFIDDVGDPFDLSDYTIDALVLRDPATTVETLATAVTGTGNNELTLTLTDTQTTTIGTEKQLTYTVSLTSNTGFERQYLSGQFVGYGKGTPRPGNTTSAITVTTAAVTIAVNTAGGNGAAPGTASLVTVVDASDNFVSTDVEGALAETADQYNVLSAALESYERADSGGGTIINKLESVSGATPIDLADGSIIEVASTAGNFTLGTPTGMVAGAGTRFTVSITPTTTGHTPTWWANISWVGGAPNLPWTGGVTHLFEFQSLDGTNFVGWHLTPAAPFGEVTYSITGDLTVGARALGVTNDTGQGRTIVAVRARVGTAPTGADVIVDINLDGSTIFTTQADRPTIGVSSTTDLATPNVVTWADGSVLTVDVDQVGSTVPGADMTITVVYRQGS